MMWDSLSPDKIQFFVKVDDEWKEVGAGENPRPPSPFDEAFVQALKKARFIKARGWFKPEPPS